MRQNPDRNKLCFITCVNDERKYEECLLYLRHLQLPEGMKAEYLAVRDAPWMTAGYAAAMEQSDAAYKIYLHQDVCLFKRDMLLLLLHIFRAHPEIGMIGLSGCTKLPTSGIWWNTAGDVYGMVAQGIRPDYVDLVRYDAMQGEWHQAEALDGLFLMTQYDLPWRQELFRGWHFYDISHCMEFRRAGYHLAIPNQQEPWCIHDCGRIHPGADYEAWRQVFLQEYRADIR